MTDSKSRTHDPAGRPPLFRQLAPLIAHWSLPPHPPARPAPQSIDPSDPGVDPSGDGPGSAQLTALHWSWAGRLEVAPYATGWHQVLVRLGGDGHLEWRGGATPSEDDGGAVSITPAGVPAGFLLDGELDLLLLCLAPTRLQAQAEAWRGTGEGIRTAALNAAFAVSDSVLTGAARLIAANREVFAVSRLFRDSIDRLVAARVLERTAPPGADLSGGAPAEEPMLTEAIKLLAEDLTAVPSVEILSAAAGLPSGRFLQVFKALTGRTPQAYQAALRISAARRLIVESTLSFGEIARRTGYPSQAALSMACRRQYGASPRSIRAQG
ncbi:MAG: AraC family transcriptional regulator [Pseudomonadota bacterium]